ncbi:short-chain dehydrogenase [Nocardioides aromaticivorans]|uniref:Short-chain dehydrogenase n=1 Tax=Nocardioides aromaticivorans TaxID=200618 RepID=A0ABX7PGR0_9ACTN|nr:SDR family oxidoreductase [Nocardioides aromaticivorans]QSR24991.1 short-chain dehydrogenase [Nocardioides aromaticivorans]
MSGPQRTVVVTGAASGIGATTASLLRSRGDRVIGVDLRDVDVCADLSTAAGRSAAVAGVAELVGPDALDGLVTCAGLSRAGAPQVSVNYFGTVDLVLGLQPLLARSAAPRVALVSSISSTQPHDPALVEACLAGTEATALELAEAAVADGRPHEIYASTKAALNRWLRRAAVSPEFAGAGIAVNAVAPGVVLTPMTEELVSNPQWKSVMDAAVPMPLNGYAPPEAIAHALLWLLAPENTHMAGQVVFVDGGAEALTVAVGVSPAGR